MSFLKYLLPAWKTNLDGNRANAAILKAIDQTLRDAEQDTIDNKIQMVLGSTSGEDLDKYGSLFGLYRKDNELDTPYRNRILGYITLERGTIPAIIEAIRVFLNDYNSSIYIYEPWQNVFYLNGSHLNGNDHLQGLYYTQAVIDIKFGIPVPDGVLDVVNDFKPAGVTVHLTYAPPKAKKTFNETITVGQGTFSKVKS
jgi:hypothetical protein